MEWEQKLCDGRVVLARITADMLDQDLGSIYRETVYLRKHLPYFLPVYVSVNRPERTESRQLLGHSHILKVKYDKTLDMLHINPGAAGMSGFHKVRTMVRFVIDNGTFKDLEVIELAG